MNLGYESERFQVSMLGPVVRKGDVVTDFELPDETGAPRRLSGLLADGPVVLFFYPAAMSLGCTVESCHFRDLIGEFKAVGAQPVGISADRVERQRHFAEKHSLGYPQPAQPVDATQALNLSAGVSNCKV